MEPRARTLIERHGFFDHDRKKYRHDEIQIWVYRNFTTIIKSVFPLLTIDYTKSLDLKLEYPVSDGRNFIVGFVDVFCKEYAIGIEVKTEIPIIGDLIRQIQFYRKYMNGAWVVVSPDDKNSIILKEQGIHFYKYRDLTKDDQLYLFE